MSPPKTKRMHIGITTGEDSVITYDCTSRVCQSFLEDFINNKVLVLDKEPDTLFINSRYIDVIRVEELF